MRPPPEHALPLVQLVDVARTYGAAELAVVAVHGASGAVYPGEHIALTGPSGSGKTTLLHLMAGLDVPTAGEVRWPAIGDRHALRPGPVGVVFQAPSLLPALDVLENVEFPLLLGRVNASGARARALAALAALGLAELSAKLPEEISSGQAQRVAIARALAGRPRLILADEPTGQLDEATGSHVVDALLEAATASGAGLVVNTHDPRIADRFPIHWTMIDGRLETGISACFP